MDLDLIAGKFLDDSLDKSKEYLIKYFPDDAQQKFVAYSLQFPAFLQQGGKILYQNFVDHTGIFCSPRVVQKWTSRLRLLESIVEKAHAESDLATLAHVKSGQFRFVD